jgi:hypothetical protein
VDLDPGQCPGNPGNEKGKERDTCLDHPVGKPMGEHRLDPWPAGDYGRIGYALGSRIPLSGDLDL